VLADELGDGIYGACDELAFEDDNVGGITLQGSVEVGKGLDLGDDANVVFEGKDLLHADAVDGLRIGENYPYADMCCIVLWNVLAAPSWIDIYNGHSCHAFRKYSSITAAAFFWPPCR